MNTERQDAIAVHVYGKLCQHLSEGATRHKQMIHVDARPDETLSTLLKRLGIEPAELYTVFLNGSIVATRNGMAPWLRYPQAQDNVWNWDYDVELSQGDRLGLFGEDMALLVV